VLEERERAAVERGRRDDRVAGLREVQERERLRGLAAGRRDGRDAALELGDPALEDVRRGVHEARVDVPELAQPEEAGGVVRPVEHVGRRRVDRDGARVRGGVGRLLRGVDGERAGAVAGFRFGGGGGHRLLLRRFVSGLAGTKKPALSCERAGWVSESCSVYLAWGRYVAVANASMPPSASRRSAKDIHMHMQIGSAA
jgi:hypothetical protein